MNHQICFRTLLTAIVVLLVGCSTLEKKPANQDLNSLGILVVCGEGLNASYSDLKASATIFTVSLKFAEAMHQELSNRGVKAQLYVNRDRTVDTKKYVGELLAQKKRDGLIQVSVLPIKNSAKNSIYLSVSYNPLRWTTDSNQRQSVIPDKGLTLQYNLSSAVNDSFSGYAKDFAKALDKAGFIGENRAFTPDDEKKLLTKEIRDKIPGDTVDRGMFVFHQHIFYAYPKDWPMGSVFRNETNNHFIVEYIPEDQTLKEWKDMFTIQGFKDLAKSKDAMPEKIIQFLRQRFYSIAPDKLYYKEIFKGDVNGTSGIIVLMGIKELPQDVNFTLPKGVGEIGLYLALKGTDDMYMMSRSWKVTPYTDDKLPMTEVEFNKWFNLLTRIKLAPQNR
jgi:hypothetical protein